MKKIRLSNINSVLRKFGLVLVVSFGDNDPTQLWIERAKTYDARTQRKT